MTAITCCQVVMLDMPIDVYGDVSLTLVVEASPLRAVIQGGIQRDVSRHEPFSLDATGSFDPDGVDTDLQ